MNELALFAGAGGGILGGKLLGWDTVCAVEHDAYAAQVLAQRQNDGILELFPIWSDIETFDGRPWRGIVDIVSGGFPCQDISVAGKQKGITGKRSGLWTEMARIVSEVDPEIVWIENSPNLKNKGLEIVLEDLWKMGYDARWGVVSAENARAPHKRERIWILAHSNSIGRERAGSFAEQNRINESKDHSSKVSNPNKFNDDNWRSGTGKIFRERSETSRIQKCKPDVANSINKQNNRERGTCEQGRDAMGWNTEATFSKNRQASADSVDGQSEDVVNTNGPGCEEQWLFQPDEPKYKTTQCGSWWKTEPGMGRVVDGLAHRVDRLKAIGNGQVPAVVRIAWNRLLRE